MRLIFMGTPDFAVPALDAVVAAGHDIAAVYTQPPRPAGRGQAERLSPVHARAEALGLPVRCPKSLRDVQSREDFASLAADAAVVAAYGLILPREVLDAPAKGCINIHASLLPRWRGAAPIHRAVMAGDAETGVCIMRMEAGLDTGPVLLRKPTPIGETETTGDLHDRLATMGAEMIVDALSRLDELTPAQQSDSEATYAPKIDKSESRVDWKLPAVDVDRLVRSLSPFPGAWCLAGTERLKLLRSRLAPGSGPPGQRLAGLTVACGDGAVQILEAQRPGRRPMSADEVLRGAELPDRLS
jgi:methionyl-tRNA formyltransferase